MAIKRVEVNDFLVFKGNFDAEFCPGINVLIGGNGTGKTSLLKIMYRLCCKNNIKHSRTQDYFFATGWSAGGFFNNPFEYLRMQITDYNGGHERICIRSIKLDQRDEDEGGGYNMFSEGDWIEFDVSQYVESFTNTKSEIYGDLQDELLFITQNYKSPPSVFIPEKDMLSNSKGIPESYKYGKAEYTQFEVDIIEKARVLAYSPEQPLYRKICDMINGEPKNDGQSFFMKRRDIENPIPFSLEASGYRKFGLLAILIRNEQIKPGTIVFWDEPENSLNPELVPVLVDILLELAQSGVQIFIATHDYNLARYFDVRKNKDIPVMFHNFSKDNDGHILCVSSGEYMKIPNNLLETSGAALFKAVAADALGVDNDD